MDSLSAVQLEIKRRYEALAKLQYEHDLPRPVIETLISKPERICCDKFLIAFDAQSDSEGWLGMLLYDDGVVRLNSCDDRLESIAYCPWCGGRING